MFSRKIYQTCFSVAGKGINLQKSKSLSEETLLCFVFKIPIPQDSMNCESFERFHQRKFKKITNKVI